MSDIIFWTFTIGQGMLTALWMFFPMMFGKWKKDHVTYTRTGAGTLAFKKHMPIRITDQMELDAYRHFRKIELCRNALGITNISLYFVAQIMNHYLPH
jgi:hypothetical protein